MKLIPAQVQLRHLLVRDFEQQQSKQQQGKFQQAASKKQTKHLTQPTASQKQKATDKPQQAFAQQLETDRQGMQENDEIAGVAGVVRRVRRSRQMGAVVGCRPKQRDSGESSPELGITKAGNAMLRRLLVQSHKGY